MAIEIRDSGQTTVTELTSEQRLYRAMEEHVDPETYDGASARSCLIGQLADTFPVCRNVSERYGVEYGLVFTVYSRVLRPELRNDYHATMRMARETLGLKPKGPIVDRDTGDECQEARAGVR